MASFNISQFTANMKGGGARPNLFKLRIPSIPSSVSVRTGLSDIEFFCRSCKKTITRILKKQKSLCSEDKKVCDQLIQEELSVYDINIDRTNRLSQILKDSCPLAK